MKTYIIYVQSPGDKIVYDKRFDAEGKADLLRQAVEYFKFEYDVVRIEQVKRVFGDIDLKFGPNFIKAV